MKKNLRDVEKEIKDCVDMDNWLGHCQIMLKSLYGFDYQDFFNFLVHIIKARMATFTSGAALTVYGSWKFGLTHQVFDIKQAFKVLKEFMCELEVKGLELFHQESMSPSQFCSSVELFVENLKKIRMITEY